MDPGTGRLVKLDPLKERTPYERKLVLVNRELTPQEVARQKIGCNAPCVCGSGKKFKHCHYLPAQVRNEP